MKIRRIMSLVIVSLSLFLMTACGTKKPEETGETTITLWHTLEEMYRDDFKTLIEEFEVQNPNIKVEVEYQGRVAEIQEKVLAENLAGGRDMPDVFPVHSSTVQTLAKDGIIDSLDSYIKDNGTNVDELNMLDTYAYENQQFGLPWTITAMNWFYNDSIKEAENIVLPETWDQMEDFLKSATKFNADGTTERYALHLPGWDSYYFTWLLWNNGIIEVDENGNSTMNSAEMKDLAKQINEWRDEGYLTWGYGSNGSTNMRQAFWDENVFAIIHTSSQYENHRENMEEKGLKLGAHLPPAGSEKRTTEVFGMSLSIPAKSDENKKEAAYKLIEYLTSPEVNLKQAKFTGFLANGKNSMTTEEGVAYLEENSAMKTVYDGLPNMQSAIQMDIYSQVTNILEDRLALIFIENEDIDTQLDLIVKEIKEVFESQ